MSVIPSQLPLSIADDTSQSPAADQISFTFHISQGEMKLNGSESQLSCRGFPFWVYPSVCLHSCPRTILLLLLQRDHKSPVRWKCAIPSLIGIRLYYEMALRSSAHISIRAWDFHSGLAGEMVLLRTDYTDIMKSITALCCWCFLSTSCDAITKFNGIFVIIIVITIIFLSVVGFLCKMRYYVTDKVGLLPGHHHRHQRRRSFIHLIAELHCRYVAVKSHLLHVTAINKLPVDRYIWMVL